MMNRRIVLALLFAVTSVSVFAQGTIIPVSASQLTTGPVVLGPPPPLMLGAIIPVSTSMTMTDEEFKKEFLRHTHPHTHKNFERVHAEFRKRITRIELRINDVIGVVNRLMPMVLGAMRRGVESDSKFQAIQSRTQKATQKVTDLESRLVAALQLLEQEKKKTACTRARLDWLMLFVDAHHEGKRPYPVVVKFPECEE